MLATVFAESNKIFDEREGKFLLEVDRLKSYGKYTDDQILVYAYQNISKI
jgi:hypothetical protein